MKSIETFTTGQFAHKIHKSISTVQKWDYKGKLKAHRTMTNRRYYTPEQVYTVLGIKPKEHKNGGKIYLYARVSNHNQKKNLDTQIRYLKQYAYGKGYQIDGVKYDVGSGLNYNRRSWNRLLDLVFQGQHIRVIVAYPDRFTRFNFKWFSKLFKKFGSSIEVINHHKLSSNQEIVSDLVKCITPFDTKIHGLKKYKKSLRNNKSLKSKKK